MTPSKAEIAYALLNGSEMTSRLQRRLDELVSLSAGDPHTLTTDYVLEVAALKIIESGGELTQDTVTAKAVELCPKHGWVAFTLADVADLAVGRLAQVLSDGNAPPASR